MGTCETWSHERFINFQFFKLPNVFQTWRIAMSAKTAGIVSLFQMACRFDFTPAAKAFRAQTISIGLEI
jgi:hypothetical protein